MKHVTAVLLSILSLNFTLLYGAEIAGVTLADTINVAGTQLQLNGAGIRKKLFLDIYVGALYLPEKTHDSAVILADDRAAAVQMNILHDSISKEKITAAWTDGMQANLASTEFQARLPTLEAFNALFMKLHRGDVIHIDYIPGKGTEVRINDASRGIVGDNAFFRDLLKVWLGERPASSSLRQAMLGKD